jgi:phage tail sheath protein FI
MPEYLAPGVYVEETSFRAKSIEGVGTSTTAFLGPTRKGPVATTRLNTDITPPTPPVPPELLTSFGDFVRTYGGLQDLLIDGTQRTNYLAHAVLNFFNEGGSRLYVARVASGATAAAVAAAGDLGTPAGNNRVFLRARFPGESGNGRVTVREIYSPATRTAMDALPEDTLLRARGTTPSEPARIAGGPVTRISVPQGAVLRLIVNGVARDATFRGARAEATSATPLPATVTLNAGNGTLNVTLNAGAPQPITLDAGDYTPPALALAINTRIQGGFARLTDDNNLVIGSDRLGQSSRVQVAQNDSFGFTAPADASNPADAANNVSDLSNITAEDVTSVLAGIPQVSGALGGGRVTITTAIPGETQTLAVADASDPGAGTVSAHAALGFTLPPPGEPPARGSNVRLYRRASNGEWRDGTNVLALPAEGTAVVGNLIRLLVRTEDADGEIEEYDEISLLRSEPRFLGRVLGMAGMSRADSLQRLFGFDIGDGVDAGELYSALFPSGRTTGDVVEGFSAVHTLTSGASGGEPGVGVPTDEGTYAAAFEQLRGLEDISIVAAPGHSSFSPINYRSIQRALLTHVALPRAYRIAVLDTPPNQLPGEARQERAQIDSTRAALYYPWVTVANPLAKPGREDIAKEINLPPSGFICGIYARNDTEQTVAKAPANEVIRGALRFESDVNFAQNQLLNPIGVNCLRYFPGRGFRVWGARTAGSDPEIKYVNVRRYLLFLEASIDRGTQWAVFENNGPRLWANITETVEAFLYNEWVSGNLLGNTPKEAFFVRCDRTTMTQNDLDNGRLICLIGVALLKPAEFVIFRIGQKTADARS